MIDKKFISITAEVLENKLVYLNASTGEAITNMDGLHTKNCLDFLFNLASNYKDVVFVCYAFKEENEFIFKDLPLKLKDELLQTFNVKRKADEDKITRDDLQTVFDDKSIEMDEQEAIEAYNKIREIELSLNNSGKIIYEGYKITLANGKQVSIRRGKTSMMIYDVFGFFRKPLPLIIKQYFQEENFLLIETKYKSADIFQRKIESSTDAFYIVKLVNHLYTELAGHGINLSRFHGASTITGAVLSKVKAKKEFRNFRNEKSLSAECRKMVNSAFYGARTEQLKLGRFSHINVYDLNSAYAKAALSLPQMKRHPIFSPRWIDTPFSSWFIEYDLPKNIYYGLLPNRDYGQAVKYKRRGKGYYWQPEIKYLMQNYPDCFEIKHGFYLPFKPARFSLAIASLYELRKKLKAAGNPLEKVIKLGLTTLYGKFCQRVGFAYYYNMFYAGFITSFVRAELLTATKGKESKTICFLTDAIHTTADLSANIKISDELGEFRHLSYETGVYLGAGIYHLQNGKESKKATRGFTRLDFDNALEQMKETGTFTATQDYFVGHNLNSIAPVEFGNYLQMHQKAVKIAPFESKIRLYDALNLQPDTIVESTIFDTYNGRESLEYKPNLTDNYDIIFDAVMAGKI